MDLASEVAALHARGHRCLFVVYGKDPFGVTESILESTLAKNEKVCVLMSEKRKRAGKYELKRNYESYAYEHCDQVMGKTYKAVILIDFGHARPSTILKSFETVRGGGSVILLFEAVFHKKELLQIGRPVPREKETAQSLYFNMFFRRLFRKRFAFFVKRRMALLPLRDFSERPFQLSGDQKTARRKILRGCSGDCYRALVIGPRGRGKSTVVGLVVARLLSKESSRILVTGPRPSSTKTIFECVERALAMRGFRFERSKSGDGHCRRISLERGHVEYADPRHVLPGGPVPDLLIVEEAAAMNQDLLGKLFRERRVVLVTTADGYEGSAKSLEKKVVTKQCFERLSVTVPTRYSRGDPLEKWLSKNVLFNMGCGPPWDHGDCRLFLVNKEKLVRKKGVLRKFFSLFTQGHYKSSPDDLMLCLDNPRVFLVALRAQDGDPGILCAMQLVVEGGVSPGCLREGNVVPWTLYDFYGDEVFLKTRGVRISRIAAHPGALRKGLGSLCLSMAFEALSQTRSPGQEIPGVLFSPLLEGLLPVVDYVGASFSLSQGVLLFWLKNGYLPFYIRRGKSRTTGEHSILVLRETGTSSCPWVLYQNEFRKRFSRSLRYSFRSLEPWLCLEILGKRGEKPRPDFPDSFDLGRIRSFVQGTRDVYSVADLMPSIAERFLFSEIALSPLQKAVLLMIGLQAREAEDVLDVLGIDFSILRGTLASAFSRLLSTSPMES